MRGTFLAIIRAICDDSECFTIMIGLFFVRALCGMFCSFQKHCLCYIIRKTLSTFRRTCTSSTVYSRQSWVTIIVIRRGTSTGRASNAFFLGVIFIDAGGDCRGL